MKQVYFATTNKGKVASLQSVLSRYDIEVIHTPLTLPEPRTDDLRKIATQKVLAAYEELKKPVIAQDSGFYIQSLNGFPRAFVNFALETVGIEGILKLAEGKPRECEFQNALAYYDGAREQPVLFESSIEGILSDLPRGELREYAWSSLFLIFIPKGETRTLAELSEEEYEELRKEIHKDTYATRFGEWLYKQ